MARPGPRAGLVLPKCLSVNRLAERAGARSFMGLSRNFEHARMLLQRIMPAGYIGPL